MSPIVSQSNSSYWVLSLLTRSELKNRSWVRLDPFIVKPQEAFRLLEYENVSMGQALKENWNLLKNLQNPEHGQWMPDALSSSQTIERTDFVWFPNEDELYILRARSSLRPAVIHERGSRYFHAVYDKRKAILVHCDGAIRVFDRK